MADGRHLGKIQKTPYLGRGLTDFDEIWQAGAVRPVTNLRSKEIQDGGGRHPNNLKITISRQRFDRSAHHLA